MAPYATGKAVTEVQGLFTEYDLDVNGTGGFGYTPLTRAIDIDDAGGIVSWLLKHPQVDVNHYNAFGDTPLTRAVRYGKEGMVQLLLQDGRVEPCLVSKNGYMECKDMTPLEIAKKKGFTSIIATLENHVKSSTPQAAPSAHTEVNHN